jgi:hypothetical protein
MARNFVIGRIDEVLLSVEANLQPPAGTNDPKEFYEQTLDFRAKRVQTLPPPRRLET